MSRDVSLPLHASVAKLIDAHHEGGITEADCLACSSHCCSLGGFALLENVLLIYERYKTDTLKRDDFVFKPHLSFKDFVSEYFDVYVQRTGRLWWTKHIVFFHVKSLSDTGHPISVPRGGYFWETRAKFFERNPWLNKGCVFLSKKVPNWPEEDGNSSRHCILHSPESGTRITEKPIDCVFFICDTPREYCVPTSSTTSKWFRSLADAFPNSVSRYKALISADESDNADEPA